MKKVYCIIVLLIKKLEYWNQGIHTGWLIRGGAYMRGGYTWSKTSVKEKEGLSAGGGGGL